MKPGCERGGSFILSAGGVQPIAEVAGDGDEPDLPPEATKFIKKKQASKKAKKGRRSSSCRLLPFAVSPSRAEQTSPS